MISALGWIRRESAAVKPTKYQLSESDYTAFLAQANDQIAKTRDEAREAGIDLDAAMADKARDSRDSDISDIEMNDTGIPEHEPERELSKEEADELAKYNLDDYDNEAKSSSSSSSDDSENDSDKEMNLNDEDESSGIFMPLSKLIKPQTGSNAEPEFDEDELDDLTLRPSDLLFVAAKTEDEISQLEIYVYEEETVGENGGIEDNLYVHHDLMLPSFPLCLEWIDYPFNSSSESSKTNFVAVGSFEKQIEIWNLDVLDLVYPTVTLQGHNDAVMSLSWNRQGRNFLASGSADNTVLLWDLARPEQGPLRSFSHHSGKVQSVAWNPTKATDLLSVAYDGMIRLFDVRAPQDGVTFASKLKGDVEQAKWRPSGTSFAVSDESGRVSFYDPRNPSEALALLDAHPKSATCIDFCAVDVNGGASLFLTASADKSLKIWSIDSSSTAFNCLLSKDMGVGKIFAAGFLPDAPLIIGAAGNRGNVNMWNLKKEDVIKSYFTQ